MSVQRYAIQVSYIPGKELLVADALSRSPLSDLADDLEYQEYNINILRTLPITEAKLEELKQSTKADPALTDLAHTVQNGWPEKRSNVPIGAQPFWNYRDEVTYHHGIFFKGNRVIVPASMRTAMLKRVHASHLGVDRCKRRARDIIFWPAWNECRDQRPHQQLHYLLHVQADQSQGAPSTSFRTGKAMGESWSRPV